MLQALRLLLFIVSMLSGIFMVNYAMDCKMDNPKSADVVFRQSCLFLGFFLLLLPFAVLYTKASGGLKRADLKLLDWLLLGYCMLMMPLIEILGLSPLFWTLIILIPAIFFRLIVTWYLRGLKNER